MNAQFVNDRTVFHRLTGVNLWLDGMITAITQKPTLDIIKIDEELQKQHGDYMDGETSMESFLMQKFGQQSVDIIKRYI